MLLNQLKIKIKSLAAEASIIRKDERRLTGDDRTSLHNHRVIEVRREARAALLAYAYMRGKPYRDIEQSCYQRPNLKRVTQIIQRFGGDPVGLGEWYEGAALSVAA